MFYTSSINMRGYKQLSPKDFLLAWWPSKQTPQDVGSFLVLFFLPLARNNLRHSNAHHTIVPSIQTPQDASSFMVFLSFFFYFQWGTTWNITIFAIYAWRIFLSFQNFLLFFLSVFRISLRHKLLSQNYFILKHPTKIYWKFTKQLHQSTPFCTMRPFKL